MKKRSTESEQLDDLTLAGKELTHALKSLAWVNQWFGNQNQMVKAVLKVIRNAPQQQQFRITDLGCGGGDVLRKLAQVLQKNNYQFTMIGIDGNENALQYARETSKDFPQLMYEQAGILDKDFTIAPCDILISSHFIYHFKAEGLIHFLKSNLSNIKLTFINSGLERSKWSQRLFKGFSFLLPMSKLAKQDGLLAIQRAYTKKELSAILAQLSIKNYELKSVPFFRLRLIIHLSSNS